MDGRRKRSRVHKYGRRTNVSAHIDRENFGVAPNAFNAKEWRIAELGARDHYFKIYIGKFVEASGGRITDGSSLGQES